jgi:hypothetical protein
MGKKASGAEPKAGAQAAKRACPSAADGADIDVLFAALPKRTQSRPDAVMNGAPASVGGVAKAQDSRGRRAGVDNTHPGARADNPRREAAPKRGSAHYLDTGERLVPVRYAWLVFLPRGEAAQDLGALLAVHLGASRTASLYTSRSTTLVTCTRYVLAFGFCARGILSQRVSFCGNRTRPRHMAAH